MLQHGQLKSYQAQVMVNKRFTFQNADYFLFGLYYEWCLNMLVPFQILQNMYLNCGLADSLVLQNDNNHLPHYVVS